MIKTERKVLTRHRVISLMLGVGAIFLFYFPILGYGQRVMLGVKVAGQMTKTFTQPSDSNEVHEDRAVVGPMAEVRLPRRISLEVDALYKRKLNYTQNLVIPDPTQFKEDFNTTDLSSSHSWEIPVLAKWRVLERRHSVFIGGGFSSRKAIGSTHTYGTTVSLNGLPPTTFDFRAPLPNPWSYGAVFTGGLDIRAGIFHFQPELRYTRWNDSPPLYVRPFFFSTNLNTVQFLIGIAAGK